MEEDNDLTTYLEPHEFAQYYLQEILFLAPKKQRRSGLFDMNNGYFVRVTVSGMDLTCFDVNCLAKNEQGRLVNGQCLFEEPDQPMHFSYKALRNFMAKVAKDPLHSNGEVPLARAPEDLETPIVSYLSDLFERPKPAGLVTKPTGYSVGSSSTPFYDRFCCRVGS